MGYLVAFVLGAFATFIYFTVTGSTLNLLPKKK